MIPDMPRARDLSPKFPVERFTLQNGLRVVLGTDTSSPAVTVAVYYDVGFRSEPQGRTGFAHLFEHLMFQGSANLEKLQHAKLVQGNGGVFYGATHNDFTNYFEMLPSNALELGLFLEADRMLSIRLNEETLQNQISVVKEEVNSNVHNRAYGGFPWLDLPMVLFETFPNAHNAYGEFADLEAAQLDDAAKFFDSYYPPGNAVLCVTGDLKVPEATKLIEKHFGGIPARAVPLPPKVSEPLPRRERRKVRYDPKAPNPAVAAGYRVPDPITQPEDYAAAVLLSEILTKGDASRLYHRLVRNDRLATHVGGSVGLVAGSFEVRDPSMLQIIAFYLREPSPDLLLKTIDDEVGKIADGIDADEVEWFRTAYVSDYLLETDGLLRRAMLMASSEQQRGRAELVNEIPTDIGAVTPKAISTVAEEWLRPDRRAVVDLRPGGEAGK